MNVFTFIIFLKEILEANSVGPYQTQHCMASEFCLCCLLNVPKIGFSLKRVSTALTNKIKCHNAHSFLSEALTNKDVLKTMSRITSWDSIMQMSNTSLYIPLTEANLEVIKLWFCQEFQ